MTDSRVSRGFVQVLVRTTPPPVRTSRAAEQALVRTTPPPVRVTRGALLVLTSQVPGTRYLRTAGSANPVQIRQSDGSWRPVKTAPTWTPDTIPGLVTWLDAADYTSGGWPNKGSGPAITIVGTPVMTVGNTLNTKPTVRFSANEGRLRSSWPYPVDDWTLLYLVRLWRGNVGRAFSVQYPPSNLLVGMHTTGQDTMYDNGAWLGPGGGSAVPWTPAPGPWKLYEADSDSVGGGQGFFMNGTAYGRYSGPGGLVSGWGLSGYAPNTAEETMDIEVAEVLLWNRRLSDPERQQAEGYLRDRWALT